MFKKGENADSKLLGSWLDRLLIALEGICPKLDLMMVEIEELNKAVDALSPKKRLKGKKRKIYLILDNLRVHHSKIVKKWVEENSTKIAIFHLPSYSPEKNPDEYLNCDLKYGLSEKPSPRNQEQLRNNVENHMLMLQGNEQRVKKYFNHNDIKYAA